MLSIRMARAATARNAAVAAAAAAAARRAPVLLRRPFHRVYTSPEILDKKYPVIPTLTDEQDPIMSGGFKNPAREKRQFRDPYGTWDDPQERRNWGEPIHEDNDTLTIFSTWEYTHVPAGKALALFATFIGAMVTLSYTISKLYPDRPSYPREYPAGLERELGGSGAMRARMEGDPDPDP